MTFGRPWWIDDAGLGVVADPLAGDQAADVVVVGGGFTGLWTAIALTETEPSGLLRTHSLGAITSFARDRSHAIGHINSASA